MPDLPIDIATFAGNSTKLVKLRSGMVTLRPENILGNYDTSADYVKEFCTFDNVIGTEIESIWGLGIQAELNDGFVEFQLSEDDGVTWRFFGGATWDAAGAEDWSDVAAVRLNIGTFPLGGGPDRSIRTRMRLRPDASGRKTPRVYDVWFLAEFEHDPMVDVLRSTHTVLSVLEHKLRCREASDGTADVVLSAFGFTVVPAAGIKVFNMTDDPGRGTDLFQAYAAGTGVVTMSAIQTVDDVLEIRFKGTAPVHLVTDSFTHTSQLPALLLDINPTQDRDQPSGLLTESNTETLIVRHRSGPRHLEVTVVVTCVTDDQERALVMAKAVRTEFEEIARVRSLATGRFFCVGDVEPLQPKVSLGDGVHAPTVVCQLWVREDTERYRQDAMLTKISVQVHGEELANVRKLLDTRRTWHDETVDIT